MSLKGFIDTNSVSFRTECTEALETVNVQQRMSTLGCLRSFCNYYYDHIPWVNTFTHNTNYVTKIKQKNLETGLFPYEESSDIKANCDILMTRISCKRFPCIGSAKDHKVNVILSANNTNSIK